MREIQVFRDFISEIGLTWHERLQKNDTIIQKDFKRKGKTYTLIARFDKNGEYIHGYLVNNNGIALINGKGFDFESFLSFAKAEIKAL